MREMVFNLRQIKGKDFHGIKYKVKTVVKNADKEISSVTSELDNFGSGAYYFDISDWTGPGIKTIFIEAGCFLYRDFVCDDRNSPFP